jgi:hypothetical protein
MIREKEAAKIARYAMFADAVRKAEAAGRKALEECTPQPMGVVEPSTGKQWHVPEGMCGFAWVTVTPGNSSLAHYLKREHGWEKAYRGGVQRWVSEGGQSIERKEAFASAFAKVMREELTGRVPGVNIYAGSRLD